MSEGARAVGTYLGHLADHAIPEALGCLAPDFRLEFGESGFAPTKDQAATALEWDAGVHGRLEWDVASDDGGVVMIEGAEGNEFLDLIGVSRLPFRSTFEVASGGLITRQVHEVSWGDVTLTDAMEPLITWAREHEPRERRAIYPNGQMVYSRPMAVRWVQLARRWRDSGS